MIDAASGVFIDDGLVGLLIPVDRLVPSPWNPNKQKDRTFNSLVQNIQEDGFDEPLQVVPIDDDHDDLRAKYLTPDQVASGETYYLIVGGHHRYEGAKVLGMEAIPCVQKPSYTEDVVKMQNVKRNMLRGKIDPEKFTKLYTEMADKYGEQLVKEQMALTDERDLKAMLTTMRDELPDAMKAQIDAAADDVKTVDDLSRVLNEMFSRHGDTLDQSYMTFEFGGRTHLWVRMNKTLKAQVEDLKAVCYDKKIDINDAFDALLVDVKPRLDAANLVPVEHPEPDFS